MARHVSLAGINGERAEVIRWCLQHGSSGGETAHEIADYMFKFHRDLMEAHGRVEKVQAVLRALEARGEVRRHHTREARFHLWMLVEEDADHA